MSSTGYSPRAVAKSKVTIRKSQQENKEKLWKISALGQEEQTQKHRETKKDAQKNPQRTNIPNMGCTKAPRGGGGGVNRLTGVSTGQGARVHLMGLESLTLKL